MWAWLLREAVDRAGFRVATRPGVDETRFCYSTLTHIVFVTAPHELHRGAEDVRLMRRFSADLGAAREWVEGADPTDERIVRLDGMELRPLTSIEGHEPQAGDAMVTPARLRQEHETALDEGWPVLDEEPGDG